MRKSIWSATGRTLPTTAPAGAPDPSPPQDPSDGFSRGRGPLQRRGTGTGGPAGCKSGSKTPAEHSTTSTSIGGTEDSGTTLGLMAVLSRTVAAVFAACVFVILMPVEMLDRMAARTNPRQGEAEEVAHYWRRAEKWIAGKGPAPLPPWQPPPATEPTTKSESQDDVERGAEEMKPLMPNDKSEERRMTAMEARPAGSWRQKRDQERTEGRCQDTLRPASRDSAAISPEAPTRSRKRSSTHWQGRRRREEAFPCLTTMNLASIPTTWSASSRRPKRARWQRPKEVLPVIMETTDGMSSDQQTHSVHPQPPQRNGLERKVSVKQARRHRKKKAPTLMSSWTPCMTILFTFLMISCSFLMATADDGINQVKYNPMDVTDVEVKVYDCSIPDNGTVHAIDLTETGKCAQQNLEEKFAEPEFVNVTQIMIDLPVPVDVYRCHTVLNKRLNWHGMHSHIYHTEHYIIDQPIYLDKAYCQQAIIDRIIVCGPRHCGGRGSHRLRIPYGRQVTKHWVSRGSFNKLNAYPESFVRDNFQDANDNVTSLIDINKEVVYAIEHSYFTVTLEKLTGSVDLLTNVLTVGSLNVQLEYDLTWVNHAKYGVLAWDKITSNCKNTIGIVGKNKAVVRKLNKVKDGDHSYAGAMVIIEDHEEGRASGMLLTNEQHHCLSATHTCLKSNVPRLLACIGDDEVQEVDPIEKRAVPNALRMELAAGLTYVHLVTKIDAAETAARLWASMCLVFETLAHYARTSLLDRDNYYNLQGMSLGSDKPLNITQQSVVRGSVAFLANCTQKIGLMLATDRCTHQVAVLLKNGNETESRLTFADAVTRQIVASASVSECSSTLPVMHQVDGIWHCFSPEHEICPDWLIPSKLVPNLGRNRGIMLDNVRPIKLTLTEKQKRQVERVTGEQRLGPVIRDRLVGTVITNSEFSQESGYGAALHLGMPLTIEDVGRLTGLVSGQMFFLFKFFGQLYLNVFGVLMVISLLQFAFNSGCRLVLLWKANNWRIGPYLIKAIFAAIFSSAILPALILKEVGAAVNKRLEEDAQRIIPDQNYEECRFEQEVLDEQVAVLREYISENASAENRDRLAEVFKHADRIERRRQKRKEELRKRTKSYKELTDDVKKEHNEIIDAAQQPPPYNPTFQAKRVKKSKPSIKWSGKDFPKHGDKEGEEERDRNEESGEEEE